MFSAAVSIGQQVEELEDEADVIAAQPRQLVVVDARDVLRRRPMTSPEVGWSRPARMCISVDLPEPRRAHDGGQLTAGDVDRDTAQGVDGGVALAVAAHDVARVTTASET
jgi:hypothetical protein